MLDMLSHSFHLLIFPGGLFALLLGLLLKGFDRKICARLQRRVGPPILQPFYDIIKLSQKETIIPDTANKAIFKFAPVFGFMGMMVDPKYGGGGMDTVSYVLAMEEISSRT